MNSNTRAGRMLNMVKRNQLSTLVSVENELNLNLSYVKEQSFGEPGM